MSRALSLALLVALGLAALPGAASRRATASAPAGAALTGIVAVVAGDGFTLALTQEGRVLAWGENDRGQIGDGTRIDRTRPVFVKGLGGSGTLAATAIAAGRRHSLAIRPDGTVVAWGDNFNGQLGDGTTMDRITPVRTRGTGGTGLLRAKSIAAGQHHSLAIRPNGTVVAWGRNYYGQLGDGTLEDRRVPGLVAGLGGAGRLTHVVAIDAGVEHSVALRENRTVVTWGYNFFGQMGDGTVTVPGRPRPGLVRGLGGGGLLGGVTAIASGAHHILARKLDGSLVAWGRNEDGQLGDGTTSRERSTPVQVRGLGDKSELTAVVGIAAGAGHSAAVLRTGRSATWGNNAEGQLGLGDRASRSNPAYVRGFGGGGRLGGAVQVAAGANHTLARRTAGDVAAWGDNAHGQVGDGSMADRLTPVAVKPPG